MELKDGLIGICKTSQWSTESTLISRVINIVTLSRYSHTFTICKENNTWYVYESHLKGGVHKSKLYEPWLIGAVRENKIDLFEQSTFNKNLFLERFRGVEGCKYWVKGLFHIGVFNIFGRKNKEEMREKFFCSHLTSYLHDLKKPYMYNSPATLGHMNELKRIS